MIAETRFRTTGQQSASLTPNANPPRVILEWTEASAAAQRNVAPKDGAREGAIKRNYKNASVDIEKLVKRVPDSNAKTQELEKILEARDHMGRNDSTTAFRKALSHVNPEPDMALTLKH